MRSRSISAVAKQTQALRLSLGVLGISLFIASLAWGQDSILILKNGMAIGPGIRRQAARVDDNAISSLPSEQISSRPIFYMQDGLRITFVNQNLVQQENPGRAAPLQRIETGNALMRATGNQIVQGVQGALAVTPFDSFGRRVYSLQAAKFGQVDIVQGITELSAAYVRVDGLIAERSYVWDMRLALSSIPADRLREILINHADPVNPQSWLNIVALYSDAKRYIEARDFLVESIRRFPELENQRPKVKQFEQLHAQLMLDEQQLRLKVGQPKLAENLLRTFPLEQLALETRLELGRRLSEIVDAQKSVVSVVELIQQDIATITDPADQVRVAHAAKEITARLSVHNLVKLADYRRLRDDPKMPADQRAALLISGWLMGSGESELNLPVALSAWDARDLVRRYLNSDAAAERESLIDQLKTMEGGNPRLVAKMLVNLEPPKALPEAVAEHPGRFEIEIPNATDMRERPIKYWLQLPPEYDPDRRYPCVVTLHGQLTGPEAQLEWWTGAYNPQFNMCVGEASRHGYIVIAPQWASPKQPLYAYTEDEHARVLRSLRDAMRRTSIDSDRVFLAGHHMGGEAAWDIALAHPDLWAGMLAVGADCEKYIVQYADNGRYVPLYFVLGAIDGVPAPLARDPLGKQLDEFLKSSKFDCMLTVYQGRGRDHFQEELPRMIEWMNLSSHVRQASPEKLDIVTARASDRQFWWLEVPELTGDNIVNPILFKPGRANIEASRTTPPENGLRVSSFPGKTCYLWLSPDNVDFSQRVSLSVKGKRKSLDVLPNLTILLEDVRTRADRKHPYWAKIDGSRLDPLGP